MNSDEMATQDGATLERGRFNYGSMTFVVRASSLDAPDSFQVHTGGNPADIVLVVSGLNSWNLRATWGDDWRTAGEEWKLRFKEQAFMVFYNGRAPEAGRSRRERFCNG
jgi:hypothetical protein